MSKRLASIGERLEAMQARARTGFAGPIPGAGEALRMVHRHGDFSGIRTRQRLGIRITSEEQAALEALDRGDSLRTGRKDPATAFESVVCWRWLVERAGWSGPDAHSLMAEMMGVRPAAIRERIKRAKGLGRNIADLTFDVHAQRDITPALLRHRTAKGHGLTCRKVRCLCDPAPRPAFADTPEGAQVAVLLSFWQMPPILGHSGG